uniref:Uncharacterized protein n=1 Tax=Spironucleus salmonicida TaxID=348837 RepID=V6LJR7_9EUKA|eukprot:EST44840.1 Hypothetical protein SS50377_15286 [Spironucleus salmonicida]
MIHLSGHLIELQIAYSSELYFVLSATLSIALSALSHFFQNARQIFKSKLADILRVYYYGDDFTCRICNAESVSVCYDCVLRNYYWAALPIAQLRRFYPRYMYSLL